MARSSNVRTYACKLYSLLLEFRTWIPKARRAFKPSQDKIGEGVKNEWERARCVAKTTEEVKGWENRGRGIVPDAMLRAPMKEKSHYSRRVPVSAKDWQLKLQMPETDKSTQEYNIVLPIYVTFHHLLRPAPRCFASTLVFYICIYRAHKDR